MFFPYYIARRYIFSKKRHNAINIISLISVCGLAFATMAMVITMSIFNGFHDVIKSSFTSFDPQLKVTARQGKAFSPATDAFKAVAAMPEVEVMSPTLEDNVMVKYKDKQAIATLKGVDSTFAALTSFGNTLYGNGQFILSDEVAAYATMGIGLVRQLNCGIKFLDALEVYAPRREGRVNMANPMSSFRHGYLYSPGSVFIVGQPEYDEAYIITDIAFARQLFGYRDEVSAVELRLRPGSDTDAVKQKIKGVVGEAFDVQDIYEQQSDVFKVINIEKLISFLFLSLIVLIAALNVIGSVAMLIIDKRDDLRTIQCLGAQRGQIVRIFLAEGWLISLLGALSGIVLGIALCLAQQHLGLVKMGDGSMFMTDAYPVRVEWRDLAVIFATVLATVMVTIWLPVRYLCKRLLS